MTTSVAVSYHHVSTVSCLCFYHRFFQRFPFPPTLTALSTLRNLSLSPPNFSSRSLAHLHLHILFTHDQCLHIRATQIHATRMHNSSLACAQTTAGGNSTQARKNRSSDEQEQATWSWGAGWRGEAGEPRNCQEEESEKNSPRHEIKTRKGRGISSERSHSRL